jgi:excisionase family DNA binding protein
MAGDQAAAIARGLTVREVAGFLRIGKDRVRGMVERGELPAINTAPVRCGRPRYVILPEHLAEWERSRRVTPPPKPAARRQQRRAGWVDFYPD